MFISLHSNPVPHQKLATNWLTFYIYTPTTRLTTSNNKSARTLFVLTYSQFNSILQGVEKVTVHLIKILNQSFQYDTAAYKIIV